MKNIDKEKFWKCVDSKWWEATRKTCPYCGHLVGFYKKNIKYVECHYCGNIVFKNKKTEFDFKVKRRLTGEW